MLVPEMNTPEWRMTTGEMSEEEATLQFTIRTFILHVQRRVLGAVGGGQPCSADAEIDGSIPSLIICGSISERGFPGLYPQARQTETVWATHGPRFTGAKAFGAVMGLWTV